VSVWVVLPTYEEAENLAPIVRAVRAALPDAHVLVVDDGSPDGTGAVADALAAEHAHVHVLHRRAKQGLGRAYAAGFAHALAQGARTLVQMDADGSHDPADLPRLLAADGDVVLGSRFVPGGGIEAWGPLRRFASRAGCAYARRVLRAPVRDLTGGYKVLTAEALRVIDPATIRSQGYAFQVEVTYRALRRGLHVREVPIVFRDRAHGRSKMTPRIALEAALRVPRLRADDEESEG